MFQNLDIGINLNWSSYLFILSILLVTGFTFWAYRRTIPPVSKPIHIVLISMRSLALILTVLVIFKPILNLTNKKDKQAIVSLLIDSSCSMQIEDNSRKRNEIVKEVIQSSEIRELHNKYIFKPILFSDRLIQLQDGIPDSLIFNGTATDITQALLSLQEQKEEINLGGALLISDGRHNRGDDPVRIGRNLDYPVSTITVGEAMQKPDIIMTKVLNNEITYVGDKVPIEVFLRGPGLDGKRVTINLRKNREIIDKKIVTIPPNGMETSFELHFMPEQPGFLKMKIEIPMLNRELTFENNFRDIYVKVLKSKLKILLIADSPSPDFAFLKRLLSADENLHLVTRVQKNGSSFYEGSFLSKAETKNLDLIILLDFPGQRTSTTIWEMVTELILRDKKPFLLFAGNRLNLQKLKSIQTLLPFLVSRKRPESFVLPKLVSDSETNPILRIFETSSENINAWHKLPPIFSAWTSIKVKPGCQLLSTGIAEKYAMSSNKEGFPLIIARNSEGEKSIAFMGHGLYRWDLLMWGIGKTNDVLKGFIDNSIRWLVTREEDKPVRFSTNKKIYRSGEEVFLSAQVYDETYRPMEKASVVITLTSPAEKKSFRLVDAGNGRYNRTFRIFESGDYRIEGEATHQGRSLGRDTTDFSVSSFNPEFLDTKANPELLESLAQVTGGKSGPPDSLASIVSNMNYPSKTVFSTKEIELYNIPLMLVVIVLLLSVEWFIRKRKGMV